MSKVAAPPGELYEAVLNTAPHVNMSMLSGNLHKVRIGVDWLRLEGEVSDIRELDIRRILPSWISILLTNFSLLTLFVDR